MKPSYVIWSVILGVLALAPFGLKALTWQGPRHHSIAVAEADAGKALFTHEWTPNDPLSPNGDGLGPVFNAKSCVECHQQGGLGGGGGNQNNVTTFTVRPTHRNGEQQAREGVVHSRAVRFQETLSQVHRDLPNVSRPSLNDLIPEPGGRRRIAFPDGVHVSQRNTPALFGAKLIDELSDQDIIANETAQKLQWGLASSDREDVPVGRAPRLANGRVGRFGWKGQTASLQEFVEAACANELGLGNPKQAQPRPLSRQEYRPAGLDLTQQQCDQLTSFIVSLPQPVEKVPSDLAEASRAEGGKKLFAKVGCADCHTPNVGSIAGVYSDLLLHRMGVDLEGGGSYNDPPLPPPTVDTPIAEGGPSPGEWRTPPLWGVADSGPYLHDGRAGTLEDAIKLHGGQAGSSSRRFQSLAPNEQRQVIAFLKTLRAP